MNLDYKEAVGEVLIILEHTEESLINKIPKQLMEFWREIASKDIALVVDTSKSLTELNLKPKTKALIAMIYRNYWCTPEERKEYDKILRENEEKFQEAARQKYNPDDIFKPIVKQPEVLKDEPEIEKENEANIMIYKENIFTKIIKKIKSILNIE